MCEYKNMPDAVTWVRASFPNLQGGRFSVMSNHTCTYNCIGWAAGDTENWWWPSPDDYWPESVPRAETIEAFRLAFQTRGYEPCDDGDLESGYEKVAIYAIAGQPKHMARQLPSGAWTSKLGKAWDIEHASLDGVECKEYGRTVEYLRRPTHRAS
jgi:hypothetical protein